MRSAIFRIAKTLMVLAISNAVTLVCGAAERQRTVMKANDFLNTLGVTTHCTQGRNTAAQLLSGLQFLGVRHFRDDGTVDRRKLIDYCAIHRTTGATMSMLPLGGDLKETQAFLDALASCGALLDVEGPNEPNNFSFIYNGVACNHGSSFASMIEAADYCAMLARPEEAEVPTSGILLLVPSDAPGRCIREVPAPTGGRGDVPVPFAPLSPDALVPTRRVLA